MNIRHVNITLDSFKELMTRTTEERRERCSLARRDSKPEPGPPPPIVVVGLQDFVEFEKQFVELEMQVGGETFLCRLPVLAPMRLRLVAEDGEMSEWEEAHSDMLGEAPTLKVRKEAVEEAVQGITDGWPLGHVFQEKS